jgi:hypothetical protein
MLSELVLLALLQAPAPVLVERIVAVVDERPVLLSDVRVLQQVKGLDEPRAREALIDELLMQREAARLPDTRVEAPAEEAALPELRRAAPDAPESALRRLARRQLAALAYIEQRFRPLVRVEPAEVQAAVDLEWPEPSQQPEDAAAITQARLEAERLDALVEEWVKELRAAASVRRID